MKNTYMNEIENAIKTYSDFWDYYGIHKNKSINEIFDNPKSFIENTFEYAEKRCLVPCNDNLTLNYHSHRPLLSDSRSAHSVSTFFLGSIIAHNLFDGVFTGLYAGNNDEKNFFEFSYMWTLTCLYHDCGYYLEQDKDQLSKYTLNNNSKSSITLKNQKNGKFSYFNSGLSRFRYKNKINDSIWSRKFYSTSIRDEQGNENVNRNYFDELKTAYINSPKLLNFPDNQHSVRFPIRSYNIISNYFDYRLLSPLDNSKACIDHGISGGIIFFDSMLKNYLDVYEKAKTNNKSAELCDFLNPNDFDNQMHFYFNQLPVFAYISDCIINHNIWCVESNSIQAQEYSSFSLDNLIGSNYHKVSFYENPLLFILSIADSIEPYKLFNKCSIDGILYSKKELMEIINKTYIQINGPYIRLKPPENCMDILKIRVNDMKSWIDIEVDIDSKDGEIIIQPAWK